MNEEKNNMLTVGKQLDRNVIVKQAYDIQEKCQDFLIQNPSKELWMNDEGELCFAGNQGMPLSRWAAGQLALTVDIGANYLNKCLADAPELAADNVNHWMAKRKRPVIMRTYDNRVRGIVAQGYSKFDAPDIVDTVFDMIPESKWDLKGSFINEERLHLRMVSHEQLSFDDPMFPAIFVDSSDVRRCAINVQFGLYRLVCTNGLVIPHVQMRYHQIHRGVTYEKIVASLGQILELVPTMVTSAEEFINVAQKKIWSFKSETDIQRYTREMKTLNITEKEAKDILELMQEKYQPTQWGIVNSITEFAQRKPVERRIELENIAGKLLLAA